MLYSNQEDLFQFAGHTLRPPGAVPRRNAYGYDRDFQAPAQSPPETAFPKSDYRYDRDFQPPAPSPPEAALQKGDFRYDRDGMLSQCRDRSPSQGLHPADTALVSEFGSPCDTSVYQVERLWGFLHDRGPLLRTKELLALRLIQAGAWRLIVSWYKKKSLDPAAFEALMDNMRKGTIIDFAQHFPTIPLHKGTDKSHTALREPWLNRIFGDRHHRGVVTLQTLQDQCKVYMIMCNMKVAEIEAMMWGLELSSKPKGFLTGEAEASVKFERLLVLHQCCTDNMYQNDRVVIQIYQSRVEEGLADDKREGDRMADLWSQTATPIGDYQAELRINYSEYRDWLFTVLKEKLYFPQQQVPAQQTRERLTIQADPAQTTTQRLPTRPKN